MSNFSEKVRRNDDGSLRSIDVQSRSGAVKFIIEDGEASISMFTPRNGRGESISKNSVSFGKLFASKNNSVSADFDETMGLLADAAHYVDENYDVDVQNHIWFGSLERGRDSQ